MGALALALAGVVAGNSILPGIGLSLLSSRGSFGYSRSSGSCSVGRGEAGHMFKVRMVLGVPTVRSKSVLTTGSRGGLIKAEVELPFDVDECETSRIVLFMPEGTLVPSRRVGLAGELLLSSTSPSPSPLRLASSRKLASGVENLK